MGDLLDWSSQPCRTIIQHYLKKKKFNQICRHLKTICLSHGNVRPTTFYHPKNCNEQRGQKQGGIKFMIWKRYVWEMLYTHTRWQMCPWTICQSFIHHSGVHSWWCPTRQSQENVQTYFLANIPTLSPPKIEANVWEKQITEQKYFKSNAKLFPTLDTNWAN